jgi:hypothetical protein
MIVCETDVKLLLGLSSSITGEEQSFITLIHPMAEGVVKSYLQYDPEQKQHEEYLPHHLHSGGPGYAGAEVVEIVGNHAYWYTPGGARTLQLTHLPLRTVLTVHVDTSARHGESSNPFAASTAWTKGTDYWIDWDRRDSNDYGVGYSGQLMAHGNWPREPGTVKVVYRGGYSPAEFAGAVTADAVSGPEITTSGVDASGISLAVHDTIVNAFTNAMSNKKKSFGFTPGNLSSEKLGDYSYTLGTAGNEAAVGLVGLSPRGKQLLEPFRHYGKDRL